MCCSFGYEKGLVDKWLVPQNSLPEEKVSITLVSKVTSQTDHANPPAECCGDSTGCRQITVWLDGNNFGDLLSREVPRWSWNWEWVSGAPFQRPHPSQPLSHRR